MSSMVRVSFPDNRLFRSPSCETRKQGSRVGRRLKRWQSWGVKVKTAKVSFAGFQIWFTMPNIFSVVDPQLDICAMTTSVIYCRTVCAIILKRGQRFRWNGHLLWWHRSGCLALLDLYLLFGSLQSLNERFSNMIHLDQELNGAILPLQLYWHRSFEDDGPKFSWSLHSLITLRGLNALHCNWCDGARQSRKA